MYCGQDGMPGHAYLAWAYRPQGEAGLRVVQATGKYPLGSVGALVSPARMVDQLENDPGLKHGACYVAERVGAVDFASTMRRYGNITNPGEYRLADASCIDWVLDVAKQRNLAVPARSFGRADDLDAGGGSPLPAALLPTSRMREFGAANAGPGFTPSPSAGPSHGKKKDK